MTHHEKEWLYGKTIDEIHEIVKSFGMPAFTAKQIVSWLYQKQVTCIEQMTNISAANINTLNQKYTIGRIAPSSFVSSIDGTQKYLFKTIHGSFIETAYIPDKERATLCVSSQAGCKMGCTFCMTAKQGFQHNLTSGEILNQMASLPSQDTLTNIVYMGMGEPLDNIGNVLRSLEILTSEWGYAWSPSRITLSTIGLIEPLRQFLEHSKVHLAVSMHNPFDTERSLIMPMQQVQPITEIIDSLKQYDFTKQRRLSFEYIMMKGLNDSPSHIKQLCKLLNGVKCRINLIRFHHVPGSDFVSPEMDNIIRFRDTLTTKGITTTIRMSRGEDIEAACGMLSTKNKIECKE